MSGTVPTQGQAVVALFLRIIVRSCPFGRAIGRRDYLERALDTWCTSKWSFRPPNGPPLTGETRKRQFCKLPGW